ncbi:MAG: nitroreductase family deazaflavin-dependent oxidoreductase [Pseudomonadales bacterium]|nr:nitroreductase family deazaflavin-dependent oxidoreductase [Pseudomonadales bacterium]
MAKNKDYESMPPWTAKQEKIGKRFIKSIAKWQTKVYELTGGRLWNTFLGCKCAILTTTGAKTGLPRKTPLLYMQDGENIVMVASTGGFSKDPFWYKNIQKNPQVQVQVGAVKKTMTAREATKDECETLWPQLDEVYEGYKEYRARTKGIRKIPILIFS